MPRMLEPPFFAFAPGPPTSFALSPWSIPRTAHSRRQSRRFSYFLPPTASAAPQRRLKRKKAAEKDASAQSPRRPGRGFLSVLDDMMEKQYGRGKMYYGPSMMRQQEEKAMSGAAVKEQQVPSEEDEYETLKSDAVLVVGGTGRSGNWVTLGLLNQGFNVRVLTREFERAEEMFGESGGNVDVFEADLARGGGEELDSAVRGARAVVFIAGNSSTSWLLFGSGPPPPSAKVLLDAVLRHAPDIDRFVLVAQGAYQEECQAALAASNAVPYVVIKPRKLSDAQGGLKSICITADNNNINSEAPSSSITRIDLAQVVCQALVHDRSIRKLAENDPDNEGDFQFPSTTIFVSNGDDDAPLDGSSLTFWTDQFSNL